MFRPQIKVLDCTVRDGGLINQWQFSDDFVRKVYIALSKAGVDYMEIGYKSSEKYFSRIENGAWKFCSEDDLKKVIGDLDKTMKLSAMADIGRIEHEDIPKKSESALDMIRVACYVKEVDKAIDLAHHCMDKGYETTINLMAVSKVLEKDLDEALEDLAKSNVPVIYLVDSFGAMYSEQIHFSRRNTRPRFRARNSAFIPTTTSSSPSPIRLTGSSRESTGSMRRSTAWAGAPATAPRSFCSRSLKTRSSTSRRSSRSSRRFSSR